MKILKLIVVFLLSIPLFSLATPVSWDFSNSILQPLQSAWSAQVKGLYFTGTSTTNQNTFPLASTTALTTTRGYVTQLANLTSNGFVKTGSGNGTLSVDTSTYLTGNQTITLSGDASGSGGTSITVTVADDSHAHTGTSLSGIDISDDTNLSADGTEIVLTGDALSLGNTLTFTTGSSTYGSTTALTLGRLHFGGVSGTLWTDFCTSITGGSGLCDGIDNASGGSGLSTSTAIANTEIIYGTSVSTVGSEAAFTYNSGTDLLTVTNYTGTTGSTTNSTSTNLAALSSINLFGGGAKTTANDLCIQLTGHADLCDGGDAGAGAGDGVSNWLFDGTRLTPSTTVGIYAGVSSTLSEFNSSNATITRATSTSIFSTAATFTNALINTLLTVFNLTVTGLADFGAAVLEIPNGTGPVADDPGELAHDTTDNQLILDDKVVASAVQKIWGVTVASTSPAFISSGLLAVPTFIDGYTITRIQCSVTSGTSKVIAVEDASANASEDITCATTNTTDDGSITNATYTASELSYIDFGATSGAVDTVSISVFGEITRE